MLDKKKAKIYMNNDIDITCKFVLYFSYKNKIEKLDWPSYSLYPNPIENRNNDAKIR